MESKDKFIRDTEFGRLMESEDGHDCIKCKYYLKEGCGVGITVNDCIEELGYYFAKDEDKQDEKENLQNLQE